MPCRAPFGDQVALRQEDSLGAIAGPQTTLNWAGRWQDPVSDSVVARTLWLGLEFVALQGLWGGHRSTPQSELHSRVRVQALE